MKLTVDIPDYNPETGIDYQWVDGHEISVILGSNEICISANAEGLVSLARFMLNLAQNTVPSGVHIHFDSGISLKEESIDLVIIKA